MRAGDLGGVCPRAEIVYVADWWALRCHYEMGCRNRAASDVPIVVIAQDALTSSPLPWDIEYAARVCVAIHVPGGAAVRGVLVALDGEEADRAVAAVAGSVDETGALLTAITGVPLGSKAARLSDELKIAARLALRPDLPMALRTMASGRLAEPAVRGLLGQPPDAARLQAAWDRFVGEGLTGRWADAFAAAAVEVAGLFVQGVLQPVASERVTLPPWAGVGVRSLSAAERIEALLTLRPDSWPETAPGWTSVAAWWGEIRGTAAGGPVPAGLAGQMESVWRELDATFLPWVRANYASLLTSAARWPATLHRVAPFLARRLREGQAERILLIVMDGMGYGQWVRLRQRVGIAAAEVGGTFAMVPTYTTVSRQSIFAGNLPLTYPDTLWDTRAEPRRWSAFWQGEGVSPVGFVKVSGRLPSDEFDLGRERVVGVVINAVDEVMHASDLLGDMQVASAVDAWADTGYLRRLLDRAASAGFEVWITADHGNLECRSAGKVAEGVAVESAGKRLRRYPNRTLRDASQAEGIVWDGIPGLPDGADPLLIAPGRFAFTSQPLTVSHGGLSLDEVVVPLVRVAP